MMNYFKNKSVAYYITAGIAFLALFTGCFFFATQSGNMGNYASGVTPETIGIFLLVGFIVEVASLVIPQYRFVHLIAVAMYGLALYKETILMPDFIAGKINNVEYNGGSFILNLIYFVLILVIVILAVVVSFLGFYKDEKEAKAEMSIKKNEVSKIVKVSSCGAAVLAAVLVGVLFANSLSAGASKDPLLTKEVRAAAKAYDYDFNPSNVVIREQDSYNWSEVSSLPVDGSKPNADVDMVYYFEGAYAEGYQGDYSQSYANLYLWDDGTFSGKSKDTAIRGYWYNSSKDAEEGVKDCLNMVSNVSKYESIICEPASGFYQWQAYIYLGFSWGTRSIIINGYEYSPEVAMVIDTSGAELKATAQEDYDISSWIAKRVLKNLTYSAVFKPTQVIWYIDDGSGEYTVENLKDGNSTVGKVYVTEAGKVAIEYVDGNIDRGIASVTATFNDAGNYNIVADWEMTRPGYIDPSLSSEEKAAAQKELQAKFSASVKVKVAPAEASEEE